MKTVGAWGVDEVSGLTLLGQIFRNTIAMMVFVMIFSVSFSANGQRLNVSESEFSLGDVGNLSIISRELKMTNIGKLPLTIMHAGSSCNCTTSSLRKRVLQPNESSTLTIYFNPQGLRGQLERTVTIHSSDPITPAKEIRFSVNVVPMWTIEPDPLIFQPQQNQPKYKDLRFHVKNMSKDALIIENIECNNDNISIEKPVTLKIKPGEQLEFIARIKEGVAPRRHSLGRVEITVNTGKEHFTESLRLSIRPQRT